MKILGIDYGRRKIGVAAGDTVTKLSEPLKVLSISNFKFQISNLIRENSIEKIVLGLPEGKLEKEIRAFGRELEKATGREVEFFDETLTTYEAQRLLIDTGARQKKRRKKEDAIAAAVMLQFYLEGRLR